LKGGLRIICTMHCPLKTPLSTKKVELAARKGAMTQRQQHRQIAVARSATGDGGGDNTPSSSRRSLLLASTTSLGAAAVAAATTSALTENAAAAAAPSAAAVAAPPPPRPFPASCKPASAAPAPAAPAAGSLASSPSSLEVARARVAVLRAVSSASSGSPQPTPESLRNRNLAGYEAMAALHAADPALFHALLASDRAAFLPLVYTPAVADACASWGTLLTRPRGLYLSADDAACAGGRGLRAVVDAWADATAAAAESPHGGDRGAPAPRPRAPAAPPPPPPSLAVISDGARILALGDLAAHGMGIPVGKCFLHSGAGGLAPSQCVPVLVDAGRGDERAREDPFYLGRRAPRLRGAAYDAFLAEALRALRGRFGPRLIVHLEDFAGSHAASLLEREEAAGLPCFDDDIQATGAAAVAAVLAAVRGVEGVPALRDQTFLFFGAGQAAVGVARCAVAALSAPVSEGGAGLSEREARARMFLVDSRGLVVAKGRSGKGEGEEKGSGRGDGGPLPLPLKAEFAREADDPVVLKLRGRGGGSSSSSSSKGRRPSLAEIVAAVGPTALVGAAGVAGAFDAGVLRSLLSASPSSSAPFRPLVFALSNPTAFSECTPEQAAEATGGRAVFAGGSPFADYYVAAAAPAAGTGAGGGRRRLRRASQANNALVFPGVALGLVAADASGLGGGKRGAALLPAARALAGLVSAADFAEDAVLPRVDFLPAATRAVAASVALAAIAAGTSGPRCLPALRAAAERAERAREGGGDAGGGGEGRAAALREAEEAIREIQFDGEAAFAASFS
jgi:malic enzyme